MSDFCTDILVIGGGPAGLGAALRLSEHKTDWLLVEAEDHFGGLAGSLKDEQGFTWDLGGHVLFSHYDTFDRFMNVALGEDGWNHHQRESWVWMKNRFVPYPFQNNLHRLDAVDRERCLAGLQWATSQMGRGPSGIGNFNDWILATFGPGIANLFLRPYNFKVWAYPPETMDYHWIGERVSVPNLGEIRRAMETGEDQVSWGPNRTFRFPRQGGTGAIWQSLGRRLESGRVWLKQRVEHLDADEKIVRTSGGMTIRYHRLISTMPLDQLLKWIPSFAGQQLPLKYSSVYMIGIGLNGQPPAHLKTKCWMYFPESNSPYYRVTVFSNYSDLNVALPGQQWSLMAEVSESPCKRMEPTRLVAQTIQAMTEDGLIDDVSSICSKTIRFLPHGYPTPFLGRDQWIHPVLAKLAKKDIYSRGRFGAWKYEVANQDHSFAQGSECVERLVHEGGEEYEPTLFMSNVVNSRRNP
ncbi:MAG: amine oxidase [Lentisphaerae bacterium GWF2_57_35]|nr:MAG: amine oxidase [Lentisphaerae bacterium GWF2_57_35]